MEMETFYKYLPSIITTLLIIPFGFYLRFRMKSLATKHDFNSALKQLKKSTKAVEDIKAQFSEKFWVKQQVWETKRESYDELLDCFYQTKNYLEFLIEFTSDYIDAFVRIGFSGEYEEEYDKAYASYIEGEQLEFEKKYHSEDALKKRSSIENDVKGRLKVLEITLQKKSIYLSEEITEIRVSIHEISTQAFDYHVTQEDYENNEEFLERQIGHLQETSKTLNDMISKLERTAIEDLKLDY
jgi:cell division protein FtsB